MYEARATASRSGVVVARPAPPIVGHPWSNHDGRGTTKEPGQNPAAPDSSLADAQGADYNNDEGHAADLALLPALFEHIAKVRYPLGTGLGRRSIWKLGEFGERRAVRGLEWISGTALVPWRRLQVRHRAIREAGQESEIRGSLTPGNLRVAKTISDSRMLPGMTVRDWFAGQAPIALVRRFDDPVTRLAQMAYLTDRCNDGRAGEISQVL